MSFLLKNLGTFFELMIKQCWGLFVNALDHTCMTSSMPTLPSAQHGLFTDSTSAKAAWLACLTETMASFLKWLASWHRTCTDQQFWQKDLWGDAWLMERLLALPMRCKIARARLSWQLAAQAWYLLYRFNHIQTDSKYLNLIFVRKKYCQSLATLLTKSFVVLCHIRRTLKIKIINLMKLICHFEC